MEIAVLLFAATGLLAVLGTAAVLRRLIATARRLGSAVEGLLDADQQAPDLDEFTAYSATVRETAAALTSAEKGR